MADDFRLRTLVVKEAITIEDEGQRKVVKLQPGRYEASPVGAKSMAQPGPMPVASWVITGGKNAYGVISAEDAVELERAGRIAWV